MTANEKAELRKSVKVKSRKTTEGPHQEDYNITFRKGVWPPTSDVLRKQHEDVTSGHFKCPDPTDCRNAIPDAPDHPSIRAALAMLASQIYRNQSKINDIQAHLNGESTDLDENDVSMAKPSPLTRQILLLVQVAADNNDKLDRIEEEISG